MAIHCPITRFQSLEKALKKFPLIGKVLQIFSNHWKIAQESFQSLENGFFGYVQVTAPIFHGEPARIM